MKIFVEGSSKEYVTPNEVVMNLFFTSRGLTYEEAVEKGLNNIYTFNSLVLLKNGLKESDLKTMGFSVNEEKVYNEETKRFETKGYIFNQNATLRTDYNNKLVSSIISSVASLDNPPELHFNFGLKKNDSLDEQLIEEAYEDALKKATTIAQVSNTAIKSITSIELKSNNQSQLSNSSFDGSMLKMANNSNINTSHIHPEDIEIERFLACVFEAE